MIFLDAHVHLHDCFQLMSFFDHIEDNVHNILKLTVEASRLSCCLFLAEPDKANYLGRIQHDGCAFSHHHLNELGGWRVYGTAEPSSLFVVNGDGFRIFLIAGQQLQTAEGLEVLAVAPKYRLSEGRPLEQMIAEVVRAEGLAIIPWGFGKWMGRRGKVLRRILEGSNPPELFIGDNGGRPKYLPEPQLFRLAKRNSVRILPGSDPLPFPDQVGRAGSYGSILGGALATKMPASEIKRKLVGLDDFEKFGRLESFLTFVKHQVLMQWVKRKQQIFRKGRS